MSDCVTLSPGSRRLQHQADILQPRAPRDRHVGDQGGTERDGQLHHQHQDQPVTRNRLLPDQPDVSHVQDQQLGPAGRLLRRLLPAELGVWRPGDIGRQQERYPAFSLVQLSSSYIAALSLVEMLQSVEIFSCTEGKVSFLVLVLLCQHPAVLCHKEPARRIQSPLLGFFC